MLNKGAVAGVLVGLGLMASTLGAAAQEEIAAAGNGGTADCSANGGAVAVGDVNSGANVGSGIGVGDTWGDVAVDGGSMANATDLSVAVNGGVGICDASGGDDNVAFEDEFGDGVDDGDGDDEDDEEFGDLTDDILGGIPSYDDFGDLTDDILE